MKTVYAFLAHLLFFVSVTTLLFAAASYAAFKIRRRSRRPNRAKNTSGVRPARVLRLYDPEGPDERP
jgi:hypothetical protein